LFGIIADSRPWQNILHLSEKDARQVQVNILLDVCKISQSQNKGDESLSTVTYLSDLMPVCEKVGLDDSLHIQEAIADMLWAQNEQVAAIQLLSNITTQSAAPGGPARKSTSHKTAAILAKLVSRYSHSLSF
jgi:serine-protein kinase ATM